MTNRTIGILAHVDAGKTTLSEQILFRTGALRALGRVDRGDTALDADPIERERGITVFSDQAVFEHGGRRYTLIDTPGHADFAAETERALSAMDAAVLLADASDGIRPHTALLAGLARRRDVKLILFLNKCDLPGCDVPRVLEQVRMRLRMEPLLFPTDSEHIAELDERFLDVYLNGQETTEERNAALRRIFESGAAIPTLCGAALSGTGVDELLDALDLLVEPSVGNADAPLDARVYKVRRDSAGRRIAYVKVRAGRIRPRDVFAFGDQTEKVNEIRIARGGRTEMVSEALPGDAVGLVGLSVPKCGDRLEERGGARVCTDRASYELRPALAAQVTALDGTGDTALLAALRTLEDEDGQLGVSYDATLKEILVRIMGPIQLEVLGRVLETRMGIRAAFSKPKVLYRETIASPVMGYGHYEPLKHYAEVNLRMEPAPRGSGISFDSECHVDDLPLPYQKLIRTHVFERAHRGVLTGAELTDVRVVLTAGRAHEKHTEGGDFREATYRAIRQGLMSAQCVLLEPFYRFEILVPSSAVGRVLSDIPAMAGTFDPPETEGDQTRVCGRGPVATFADYPTTLKALTRGEGGMTCFSDGYDLCHDADRVIEQTGYRAESDLEQPASSVFCSHGAGVTVPWNEAQEWMHCLKR